MNFVHRPRIIRVLSQVAQRLAEKASPVEWYDGRYQVLPSGAVVIYRLPHLKSGARSYFPVTPWNRFLCDRPLGLLFWSDQGKQQRELLFDTLRRWGFPEPERHIDDLYTVFSVVFGCSPNQEAARAASERLAIARRESEQRL